MNEQDDEDLFAEAMQDVAPISKGRKLEKQRPSESEKTQQHRRDAAEGKTSDTADPNFLTLSEVPPKQPLEYLEWKKDGVQLAVFDKLRRGGYKLEDQLDLHGKTVKEARVEVFNFLRRALGRDQRCVWIAHGKGELSKTPGRLKSYLAAWLTEHPEVIAFCSAERQRGGVGAVYVLLRKSPASRELNREEHGLKS